MNTNSLTLETQCKNACMAVKLWVGNNKYGLGIGTWMPTSKLDDSVIRIWWIPSIC